MESITFLLKFLQNKTLEDGDDYLHTIRSTIDSSASLRDKIKLYMSKLDINIQQFGAIRTIFILSTGSSIFYHVKKQEFLAKSLTSRNNPRTAEFYTKWFLAFMTSDKDQQSVVDTEEFKQMLKQWTAYFGHIPDLTIEIIQKIDSLLLALDDHPDLAHFIQQMVDLCFQQSNLS